MPLLGLDGSPSLVHVPLVIVDSVLRPWFQRAVDCLAQDDCLVAVSAPYIDPVSKEPVLTFSVAVALGGRKPSNVAAVLGMDIPQREFGRL
jgi:hypothetical protein